MLRYGSQESDVVVSFRSYACSLLNALYLYCIKYIRILRCVSQPPCCLASVDYSPPTYLRCSLTLDTINGTLEPTTNWPAPSTPYQ